MNKQNKREKKGRFINVVFSVIERGTYTNLCIGNLPFCCIGTKKGFPNEIAGKLYLEANIKNKLDKRVDPELLAQRLQKKFKGKNLPKRGICTYRYYLWDCKNVLTAGLKKASFFLAIKDKENITSRENSFLIHISTQMKSFYLIVGSLMFLGLLGLWWFWYYWWFITIEVTKSVQWGETIVYQEVKGDYGQTHGIMDEVYYYLLEQGIETYKGIWMYLDHPDLVPIENLRSEVGCIIEEEDLEKLSTLEQYAVKVLEEKEYMVVTFPYKGVPSIFIWMWRAYPALEAYAKQQGYNPIAPAIEIYNVKGGVISFRQEVIRDALPYYEEAEE